MDDTQQSNNTQTPESDPRLASAKRRALEELAPLLGNLDVDPDRKFEICMSAIRLTDNRELVDAALEAALAIPDAGSKAEALVELVTEITYLEQS